MMSHQEITAEQIAAHFGTDRLPALFDQANQHPPYLAVVWRKYQAVMEHGEIDATTKELMGLAVAAAKTNDYVISLQKRRLRAIDIGTREEWETLAVAEFFEGFDAFAQSLRIDSDLRPRKLASGDMSGVDREVDVNVPYVITSDDPIVCEVYAEIKARFGMPFVPNIFKALAHQPAMLQAKWESYKTAMGPGRLRPLTKELIAIAVSAVNACFY